MPLIFLAYRRSDTGHAAGRLYRQLADRFGDDEVFRDVQDIPKGVDWVEKSERELQAARTLVAPIGHGWLAPDAEGGPRLFRPDDRVRVEIEVALDRGIPILPVLVDGVKMPTAADLPESIAQFARFNAQPLDDHSFDFHVGQIADAVEQLSGQADDIDIERLMPGDWDLEIHYPNGFTTKAVAEFRTEDREFSVVGSFEIIGEWGVGPDGHLALKGRQSPVEQRRFRLLPRPRMPYLASIKFAKTGAATYKGIASTGEWAEWTKRSAGAD